MKKTHQYKLMVFLTIDIVGMILLIILLGLDFSWEKLVLVFIILLLMIGHLGDA